jgi:hypothetical protein
VLETAPGGVETDIGTADTNVFGAWYFAVPNTLTPAGHWSFRATFDGESTDLPAQATTGVDVGNPAPSLTFGTSATTILIGKHVTLTAQLGAWHSNDVVSIYGTTGGGAPQLVGSGAVDVNGIFAVTLSPTHNTVYSASWAGDDTYLPATSASRSVSVRAKVAIVQWGYYRSSRGVQLFHYRASCWTRHTHCPLHRAAAAQHGRERHPVHPPAAQLRPLADGGDRHHRHQRERHVGRHLPLPRHRPDRQGDARQGRLGRRLRQPRRPLQVDVVPAHPLSQGGAAPRR